ncbi:unnamed protein product [Cuscuta campestris]|uniref:C3H1-type domain-containing protein n=1 Tax=Cuscuta campestris TaxID=132261 RepID=A0A484NJM6_9ASTE|nr:unnamed protein product [Cuscuta campestris]
MEGEELDSLAYTYKVKRCTVGRRHSWLRCPFYHPEEGKRRRDPNIHSYRHIPCRYYHGRRRVCPRGDNCHYSHGVSETWYHPDRFQTRLCNYGSHCERVFCSFAHSREELRPPDQYTIIRAQQHHPDRFRTKLCKYRPRCKRAFCSFAHGLKQLRRPVQYRNNRNPENSGPSSSAAVVPQATIGVHDQRVRPAAVIPSATQRANGNDHASLNSPAMNMPDLFGQWRRKEFR